MKLTETVAVCGGCDHWQIDFPPSARRLGGDPVVLRAAAEAHHTHLWGECPGGDTGRIKVAGRWVERPTMESGKSAQGVLVGYALPRWWVWR